MNRKRTILISVLILVLGATVTTLIFLSEPTAKMGGATRETAMLVEVVRAKKGTYRPLITAMGTVKPSRDIILSPRVSGQIIHRSPRFTPGELVSKGETLLQIDPADYENNLKLRESGLRQAEANLDIEMGRQEVAQEDYQLMDEELPEEKEALILRKPQLQSVRAREAYARAAREQARLDLQRTTIRAPFDAHILSRDVNLGSQVTVGGRLGRLAGTDTYWVVTTVPLSHVQWLSFPGEGEEGAPVRIRNRTAWPEDVFREGHLYKLVGTLEEQTRMARVLVNVDDPLAHRTDSAIPAMMIGSYVEVRIPGKEIPGVVRLSRDYLRQNGTVWLMQAGKLKIQKVDVVMRDARYAYIHEGISDGDTVVTSNIATVVDGAALRLGEKSLPADDEKSKGRN